MRKYRDKKINFRLLEDEYVYIKSLQEQSGLNLSQYIIRCCMNKKIKKINGLKETLFELNKIGNNLNQLTKKVHQGEISDPGKNIEKIGENLNKLFNKIANNI